MSLIFFFGFALLANAFVYINEELLLALLTVSLLFVSLVVISNAALAYLSEKQIATLKLLLSKKALQGLYVQEANAECKRIEQFISEFSSFCTIMNEEVPSFIIMDKRNQLFDNLNSQLADFLEVLLAPATQLSAACMLEDIEGLLAFVNPNSFEYAETQEEEEFEESEDSYEGVVDFNEEDDSEQ